MLATTEIPSDPEVKLNKLTISEDWDQVESAPKFKDEPLLKPNPRRFVLFPIEYHDFWMSYKDAEAKFWSAEEVELSDDADHWKQLAGKEKSFILQIVGLISANDHLVGDLITRFSNEIQSAEARCFFGFMIMQKNIHSELFTVLLDLFSASEMQRDDVMEATCSISSVGLKSAWVQQYISDSSDHISSRIMALGAYHAIFGSSLYNALFHVAGPSFKPEFSRRDIPLMGMLHGVYKLISDNARYTKFVKMVKTHLVNAPSTTFVQKMVADAVRIEQSLISDMFKTVGGSISLGGKPLDLLALQQHVEFTGNQFLKMMGIPFIKSVQDPLPWITAIIQSASEQTETNGNVQKSQPAAKKTEEEVVFSLEEDF